ncbi:MAG: glycosyltransferase [Gemmatimonadota bacterium]|nr:glycosyltransferase [Gemmatimonadota bacterium]
MDPTSSARLRVLDVTTFFAPASGGVRTYLESKGAALARRGLDHTMVVPDADSGSAFEHGTRIHRVRSPRIPFTPGYRLLLAPFGLQNVIEAEQPDVIEVGSPFVAPFLTWWATARAPVPTVGFYHADLVRAYAEPLSKGLDELARERVRRSVGRYVRAVYSRFDVTVAASASVARDLVAFGLGNVECIPLGVDLERFTPGRRRNLLRGRVGCEVTRRIGLFAGRLAPEKELDVVLDAHALLDPATRPFLVLIGTGPDQQALRARAAEQGHVCVLPFVADRAALADLYADADFYVASGPGETFGLSVGEAMASGLPVLGVDSGAVPDRIGSTACGWLYRRGDVASCAEGLFAAAQAGSPRRTAVVRSHAEQTLSWEITFDRLTDLYRRLARSGRDARNAVPA